MKTRNIAWGIGLWLVAALGSTAYAAPPKEYTVDLHDQAPYFTPKRLKVERGSKVTWRNHGPGLSHTVHFTSEAGVARSGPIPPRSEWTFTFTGDAVVRTACEIHPYMYGIVIVGQPSASLIAATESQAQATPSTGAAAAHIIEYPIPVPNSVPGILAIDRQDNIWVTLGGGGWANIAHPPLNNFGRLTADGDFTVYTTPTPASGPSGLLIDPGGNVLITELMGGKIARFNPTRRTVDEIPIPTPTSWPTGLALDRSGNLWFNETKGDKVGRLSPEGALTEFPVPTPGAHPTGMDIDSRGNVWIAERDASKIACLRPDGVFVEYKLPTARAKPAGVAVDRRDRVWFAEREGNQIGVIEDGRIREYPLPTPHAGPFFIAFDRSGLVWFSEVFANQIGVLNPDTGRVVEFWIPTPDSWPGGLAFDSQGALWFTEQLGNKVATIPDPIQALNAALQRGSPSGASSAHTPH
jgi:streptogramin lyase/plastocyanin